MKWLSLRRVKTPGYMPAEGVHWANSTCCFLAPPSMSEKALAEAQRAAQHQLNELLEDNFQQKAVADPSCQEWVLVTLEGWWMKATRQHISKGQDYPRLMEAKNTELAATAGEMVAAEDMDIVYVDCCYAFVPRAKLGELDEPALQKGKQDG